MFVTLNSVLSYEEKRSRISVKKKKEKKNYKQAETSEDKYFAHLSKRKLNYKLLQ